MTDRRSNVLDFPEGAKSVHEQFSPGEAIPITGPMLVEDWMSAIFKQIHVANPECFNADFINYDEIEHILRGVAYYGIRGEEPRRRPPSD